MGCVEGWVNRWMEKRLKGEEVDSGWLNNNLAS